MNWNKAIFLAHASEDQSFVKELYKRLKDNGLDPWLDKENLEPGVRWEDKIKEAIKNARWFLACFSKNSIKKNGFIQKEFRMALSEIEFRPPDVGYFIPVLIDDTNLPDISVGTINLKDYHAVEIFNEAGVEKLIKYFRKEANIIEKIEEEEIELSTIIKNSLEDFTPSILEIMTFPILSSGKILENSSQKSILISKNKKLKVKLRWETPPLPEKYAGYWRIDNYPESIGEDYVKNNTILPKIIPATSEPVTCEVDIDIDNEVFIGKINRLFFSITLFSKMGIKVPCTGFAEFGYIISSDFGDHLLREQKSFPVEVKTIIGNEVRELIASKDEKITFHLTWSINNLNETINGYWKIELFGEMLGGQNIVLNERKEIFDLIEFKNTTNLEFYEVFELDLSKYDYGIYRLVFLVTLLGCDRKTTNLFGVNEIGVLQIVQYE